MDFLKTVKIWTLAVPLAMGLALNSCDLLGGGDDDDEVSITLEGSNATEVNAGNKISIDGKVKGNTDINITTSISSSDAGVPTDKVGEVTAPVVQPGSGKESWKLKDDANLEIVTTANACNGVYKLTITAKAGTATSSKEHEFTVKGGKSCDETPLATTKTGQFYHIEGASGCTGAYDLVGDKDMASSATKADKDMKNTDAAGSAFTGSWGTGTGNSTKFVKSNSYAYASATVESAKAAYDAGSPSGTVSGPAVDDIYIAKLRDGSDYAVIKITAIEPNSTSCNAGTGNKGKISFEYKKK